MKRTSFIMGSLVLSFVIALCLASLPDVAWACQGGPPPDCGPTAWTAGESSWYVSDNWNAGVPSNCKTARVDNAGTSMIASNRAKAKALEIGVTVAGSGTVTLSSGAELRVDAREFVGLGGFGEFLQVGGSHFVSCGTLTIAEDASSYGNYYLDDGLLSVKNAVVANEGAGTFIQAGGLHKVTCGDLAVALAAGSFGTYILDGGSIAVSRKEIIGKSGHGTYAQTAGTNACQGIFQLGVLPGSHGDSRLSGGSLLVSSEVIGDEGLGTFLQEDGMHIVSENLTMAAEGVDSIGTYLLEAGMFVVGRKEWIGSGGSAAYYQIGGTHVVGSTLSVGGIAGSYGLVEIEAGNLKAGRLEVGTDTGGGYLGIYFPEALVEVAGSVVLGANADMSEFNDGAIHMTGKTAAFINRSIDELRLIGLAGLDVIFEGGIQMPEGTCGDDDGRVWRGWKSGRYDDHDDDDGWRGYDRRGGSCGGDHDGHDGGDHNGCGGDQQQQPKWATYEVAGADVGNLPEGYVDNFVLRKLVVGGVLPAAVRLVDLNDNGNAAEGANEALYVHDVIVGVGSTLDLNGLNMYANGTLDIQGTVTNGVIQQ